MDIDTQVESTIKNEIRAGIRPSVVFRRLLKQFPSVEKYSLGSHLRVAFEDVDGMVWNIVVHWQYAKNLDAFDMWMDIQLIDQLLKAGYSVPWTEEWLQEEWSNIRDLVLPPKDQKNE